MPAEVRTSQHPIERSHNIIQQCHCVGGRKDGTHNHTVFISGRVARSTPRASRAPLKDTRTQLPVFAVVVLIVTLGPAARAMMASKHDTIWYTAMQVFPVPPNFFSNQPDVYRHTSSTTCSCCAGASGVGRVHVRGLWGAWCVVDVLHLRGNVLLRQAMPDESLGRGCS
jgi:hypothetical protein